MSEFEIPMRVVEVHMRCPKCLKGEMLSTGHGFSSWGPTEWDHKCDKCGAGHPYTTRYPSVQYRTEQTEKDGE